MRILVAHNVSRARNGGMSRIMGEIHDRIAASGAQVDYFCSEDVPRKFQNRWQRFTFPYLVARRAAQGKYDIVNVHEPSGALVALLKGKSKVVVTSHGVEQRGWEIELSLKTPSLKTRLLYPLTSLWQSRLALTRADHVFCLNEQDRAFLTARFGLASESITRIFPAASSVYSKCAHVRDYARFRRVLFAGTWLTRKGNRDAVAALVQANQNLELAILNGGVPRERILADFPEAIRPRVIVQETSSDGEAAQAMAAADVFLLPSIFEGTPLTLMEAMYSGLPVITTDTCGMRDVIENHRTGLLVPVRSPNAIAQAMKALKDSPDLRRSLGQAAYRTATERYTWTRSAELVQQAYVLLVQGRGTARRS